MKRKLAILYFKWSKSIDEQSNNTELKPTRDIFTMFWVEFHSFLFNQNLNSKNVYFSRRKIVDHKKINTSKSKTNKHEQKSENDISMMSEFIDKCSNDEH